MKSASALRYPYRLTGLVFFALLVFAFFFITRAAEQLPPMVASHFDAAGQPNAFMTRSGYIRFALLLAVGVPVLLVAILTAVYASAADMKLPNRDYWLAPERIDRTRAFLIAHGIWFGSLLVTLVCFVHWLELLANRQQPPHLPSAVFAVGLSAFLTATALWIGSFLLAFRRPRYR